jgi:hypothetical protein
MHFYVRLGVVSYLFAFALLLHAQLPSGSISGIATDPSGKLVQGAQEGFNILNEVNVRGTSNANFAGRNISISPFTASASVQTNFFQAGTIAGGFFGSGGPRAFQFAARLEF